MDQAGPEATLLTPAVSAGKSSWQADVADATRAARGDMRAFERLYRAHAGRIHGLACRMLSSADAAEATQDVFVRAWQKLGSYRGEAAFGTWLQASSRASKVSSSRPKRKRTSGRAMACRPLCGLTTGSWAIRSSG